EVQAWGSVLDHALTFVVPSRLPVTVEFAYGATLPGHPPGGVVLVRGQGAARWQVPCRTRGRWRLGSTAVRLSDPFGLLPPASYIVAPAVPLLVLPRLLPLRRCALQLPGIREGSLRGRIRSEMPPAVCGARPFEPGDTLAQLDPYATA